MVQSRTYLPVADHNGNIERYVDAWSGKVVAEFEYSPFGVITGETGYSVSGDECRVEEGAFPYRFSTKYWDAEIGLCYYGYRYYDPRTGKWLNRDPEGEAGGVNVTVFCGNDPVNRVDPWGLDDLHIIGTMLPMHSAVARTTYVGGSLEQHIEFANSVNTVNRGTLAVSAGTGVATYAAVQSAPVIYGTCDLVSSHILCEMLGGASQQICVKGMSILARAAIIWRALSQVAQQIGIEYVIRIRDYMYVYPEVSGAIPNAVEQLTNPPDFSAVRDLCSRCSRANKMRQDSGHRTGPTTTRNGPSESATTTDVPAPMMPVCAFAGNLLPPMLTIPCGRKSETVTAVAPMSLVAISLPFVNVAEKSRRSSSSFGCAIITESPAAHPNHSTVNAIPRRLLN